MGTDLNKNKVQEKPKVEDSANIKEKHSNVSKEILRNDDIVIEDTTLPIENDQHNQSNKTEKLSILDLSIINQPKIKQR